MKNLTLILAIFITTTTYAQTPNYIPTNGLIGWWPFTGNANDGSGNNNNGTLVGGPVLTTDRFANANSAYTFTGYDDIICTTNQINDPDTFSVSIWFKSVNPGKLFTCGGSQCTSPFYQDRSIWINTNGDLVNFINNLDDVCEIDETQGVNCLDGIWKHCVYVVSNNGASVYIDGVLRSNNPCVNNPYDPEAYIGWWRFGGIQVGNWYPNSTVLGSIDDVAIYSRALTSCEISQIYSGQVSNINATITPQGNTTFCQGGSVTLNANTGNNYSYQWYNNYTAINNATSSSYSATLSGSYTVEINDGVSCSISSSVSVTVNPNPSSGVTISGNTTFCQGGSITLTSQGTGTYLWSPNGETTSAISATQSGTYSVTVTNNNCSVTSQATTVTVNPVPTATITPQSNTTFCQGGFVVLNASTGNNYTYQWYNNSNPINNATAASYTANQSGSYTVVVNNGLCSLTSTATVVTVNANPSSGVTVSGITTFCAGGSVTLTSQGTGTYLWSPNGETTQAISATQSGSYSVTVTNNNCSVTSQATTVTVNPVPTATITPQSNTTFCQGGFVTLTASSGGTYLWNTGATTQSINATLDDNYTVIVTANGCSATSTATSVTVNPNPTVTLSSISALCSNAQAVTLSGGSPANGSYTIDGNAATAIQPWLLSAGSHPVVYSFTNGNGCTGSATQNVTINAAPTVTLSGLGTNYLLSDNAVQLSGTPAGGIFTGAGVQGNMFDPALAGLGTHSIIYMYSNGCMNADGLCTTVDLQIGIGGEDMNGNGGNLSVMPNPNSGSFTFNLNAINPLGFTTIEIFNSIGQLIQTETINNQTNTLRKQVELNVAKGIYTIRLTTNGNVYSEKLIVK